MNHTPKCCSVHTHSTFCDGKNTLAEMAQAAFDAGVRYFGASGHACTHVPSDQGNVLPEDPAAYRREVLRLRETYQGRMEVMLGIEWDNLSVGELAGYDYWIGSVHGLQDRNTGTYYCVDWNPENLAACRDEMFHGDFSALIRAYYAEVAAMAARKPTILGHIDLITKFNESGEMLDEHAPAYRRAALSALHAADPAATLLEINTGAIQRGYRTVPYPAPFILEEWRSMGGRIILTADAHTTGGVVFAYDQAAALARAAHFERCAVLTPWGVEPCSL